MAVEPVNQLTRDLLLEILGRVDGPTVASAACVCTNLHEATGEEALWKELCRRTWPSTSQMQPQTLISTIPGGFFRFYSDSLPLVLYKTSANHPTLSTDDQIPLNPSDLVSFVDVYYKNWCVMSRVVHGIPEQDPLEWFLECPFKLSVVDAAAVREVDEFLTPLPSAVDTGEGIGGFYRMVEEMRLSWVVLDLKSGKAVNISSWRPTWAQRNWPTDGDMLIKFGCAIPLQEQLLPDGAASCVISVRYRLEGKEKMRWIDIGLQVENTEGAHANGRRSLTVLKRLLECRTRTRDHVAVEQAYQVYEKARRMVTERKDETGMAEKLYTFGGIVVFAVFCFLAF